MFRLFEVNEMVMRRLCRKATRVFEAVDIDSHRYSKRGFSCLTSACLGHGHHRNNNSNNHSHGNNRKYSWNKSTLFNILDSLKIPSFLLLIQLQQYTNYSHAESKSLESSLPEFSMEEVQRHTTKEAGGIWVIFGEGVYDITSFVQNHPGIDE